MNAPLPTLVDDLVAALRAALNDMDEYSLSRPAVLAALARAEEARS